MQSTSILITGASSGIGAALARSLAGAGRTLALVGRDGGRLEAVAMACRTKGADCHTVAIDVLDHERLADFIDRFDYVTTPLFATHQGWRIGEVSIEVAAQRILRSVERNRGLSGFPLSLHWLARTSLLAPEALRHLANRIFRFHLGEARR